MTATLVAVDALTVRYRGARRASVRNVSFQIPRGETLALVGESGSGKTTVARALLRLVEPESGSITFDGTDLLALSGERLRVARRRFQVVFQDPATSLSPRMTVESMAGEGIAAHGIATGSEARERVASLLAEVGLTAEHARRRAHELSGGERQRVAIARALATDPVFLILDEAVSALDVTTQARILTLLGKLREARGLTCLVIAHNLAVVQRIANTVAVMRDGEIVEMAPARELLVRPGHPYTRALLDAVPRRDGTRGGPLRH